MAMSYLVEAPMSSTGSTTDELVLGSDNVDFLANSDLKPFDRTTGDKILISPQSGRRVEEMEELEEMRASIIDLKVGVKHLIESEEANQSRWNQLELGLGSVEQCSAEFKRSMELVRDVQSSAIKRQGERMDTVESQVQKLFRTLQEVMAAMPESLNGLRQDLEKVKKEQQKTKDRSSGSVANIPLVEAPIAEDVAEEITKLEEQVLDTETRLRKELQDQEERLLARIGCRSSGASAVSGSVDAIMQKIDNLALEFRTADKSQGDDELAKSKTPPTPVAPVAVPSAPAVVQARASPVVLAIRSSLTSTSVPSGPPPIQNHPTATSEHRSEGRKSLVASIVDQIREPRMSQGSVLGSRAVEAGTNNINWLERARLEQARTVSLSGSKKPQQGRSQVSSSPTAVTRIPDSPSSQVRAALGGSFPRTSPRSSLRDMRSVQSSSRSTPRSSLREVNPGEQLGFSHSVSHPTLKSPASPNSAAAAIDSGSLQRQRQSPTPTPRYPVSSPPAGGSVTSVAATVVTLDAIGGQPGAAVAVPAVSTIYKPQTPVHSTRCPQDRRY